MFLDVCVCSPHTDRKKEREKVSGVSALETEEGGGYREELSGNFDCRASDDRNREMEFVETEMKALHPSLSRNKEGRLRLLPFLLPLIKGKLIVDLMVLGESSGSLLQPSGEEEETGGEEDQEVDADERRVEDEEVRIACHFPSL